MHFSVWSCNSTISPFFTNFIKLLTWRLHSPAAWKALSTLLRWFSRTDLVQNWRKKARLDYYNINRKARLDYYYNIKSLVKGYVVSLQHNLNTTQSRWRNNSVGGALAGEINKLKWKMSKPGSLLITALVMKVFCTLSSVIISMIITPSINVFVPGFKIGLWLIALLGY